MTDHVLKCWPDFFQAVKRGDKPFELRINDRDYQVGDTLVLQEYNPTDDAYSGDELWRLVTYMIKGPVRWGLAAGSVIMALGNEQDRAHEQGAEDSK